jgi:hypothetical protein
VFAAERLQPLRGRKVRERDVQKPRDAVIVAEFEGRRHVPPLLVFQRNGGRGRPADVHRPELARANLGLEPPGGAAGKSRVGEAAAERRVVVVDHELGPVLAIPGHDRLGGLRVEQERALRRLDLAGGEDAKFRRRLIARKDDGQSDA